MNTARVALAATLLASAAQAQLMLSGRATGQFTDTPGPNDTLYHAPDGSSAWFKSGIPEHATDKQTAIEFSQKLFTDIGPGLVADNLFKITNGRTLLHSTATTAHFDLTVELTSPELQNHLLTSIPFTIENTPNGPDPQSVDDRYTLSSGPIAPFKVGNYMVQFTFTAPDSVVIRENQWASVGELRVNFTPVPEPSTYAAAGGLLMLGLIGARAVRRRKSEAIVALN